MGSRGEMGHRALLTQPYPWEFLLWKADVLWDTLTGPQAVSHCALSPPS